MRIKAIFENWHIGDGNYPPLSKSEKVNLAFCIEEYSIESINTGSDLNFRNIDKNKYEFAGVILQKYSDSPNTLLVIDSGDFKFYIEIYKDAKKYSEGMNIVGNGYLKLDYFIWAENVNNFKGAPDIFYNLEVKNIYRIDMPEEFISRSNNSKSFPSSLNFDEYKLTDENLIMSMENNTFDTEFYLIEFEIIDKTLQIPLTFIN